MNTLHLIALYYYICESYDKTLSSHCQRFSNNNDPKFTDEELLTIYLYTLMNENCLSIRSIYDYASRYLKSWFPSLPSYTAFNYRLNRMGGALQALLNQILMQCYQNQGLGLTTALVDSMPIILAQGPRCKTARVAKGFADMSYCASKRYWYYGFKLHCLGLRRSGQLPLPIAITISSASENDNTAFKNGLVHSLQNLSMFADKAYDDRGHQKDLEQQNIQLLACQRRRAYQGPLTAWQSLFSQWVSRHRQPIESLFNWLLEKVSIQNAAKVRSFKGFLVFIFGRLSAAFLHWLF